MTKVLVNLYAKLLWCAETSFFISEYLCELTY